MNPFSLEGKTILITAQHRASKATALLCPNGSTTVLIDLTCKAGQTAAEAGTAETDIHRPDPIGALCSLVAQLPKLDGVFSNAGIVKSLLAAFNEPEDMDQLFKVNTFSHINLLQELIKQKKLNKGASIVITSSMSGVYCGIAGGSLYGATKSALVGYSKALALELAPRGIRVNTLHPGMIETPLTQSTALSQGQLDEDAKNYPLGRYGKPEEVAGAAVYLLSDATVWMTGTQLLLDGGYSLK